MNRSVVKIQHHLLPLTSQNWLSMVQKPVRKRPQYQFNQGVLHIGQVAARFLGLPLDEDEYYNHLYELVHEGLPGMTLLSQKHLNQSSWLKLSPVKREKIERLTHQKSFSIQHLLLVLEKEQMLVTSSHPALQEKLREAYIHVFQAFAEIEKNGLKSSDLTDVLSDVVAWSLHYLSGTIEKMGRQKALPSFLWYGKAEKSEQYFLLLLLHLGCDLLLFSPDGEDPLFLVDRKEELTFVHRYPRKQAAEPFPETKRKRKTTVAYRVEKEIEFILYHDGLSIYKPWQLRDYIPSSVTLKTTFDELFLIAEKQAFIRPGFAAKNGIVTIPVLFAKVQGMNRKQKEYWEKLHRLTENENSLLVREFPFMRLQSSDYRFHYRRLLHKDGKLCIHKLLSSRIWKYRHLSAGLQKGMASAIKEICANPYLKPLHYEKEEEIKSYLFTVCMQLPEEIVRMLQRYDYAQTVPKLIIYNNGVSGTFSQADAALLLFLNHFGIDIILFHPAGQSDIETYVDSRLFDTHWLDDLVFEQEYKEPSPLRKFSLSELWKSLRREL